MLSACTLIFVFAGNFFASRPIISGPDMFKCSLLLLTFIDATMPLLGSMSQLSKVRKSMIRLQELLQKASYEMDARYTTAQDRNPSKYMLLNER